MEFDIVIIGSGAGGGTIANELAANGKKIAVIERGDFIKRELDNWDARKVFIDRIYRTNEEWRDKKGRKFHPNTNYFVGGNTTFYGAALMRMKAKDFDALAHFGGEISPAWPLSYTDFAPYYDKAEKLWNVHGARGIDPTDDLNAPPFPKPAINHDEKITGLLSHLAAKGMTPSPLPLGVDYESDNSKNGNCVLCPTCAGHPCLTLGKSDARTICIAPSIKNPNVTLLTNTKALRFEAKGKEVKSLLCEKYGAEIKIKSDVFILAAGAVNSAVLLLNSAQSGHENGLGNSSGLVGRNYMFHTTSAMASIMWHEIGAVFPKTFCVMDYYFNDKDGGFDYPMGQIQSLPAMTGPYVEGQVSHIIPHKYFPNWISDFLAKRMIGFMIMSEDLPKPENRVRINHDGEIVLEYTPNNLEGHKRLINKLQNALRGYSIGNRTMFEPHFEIDQMIPLLGTAHQCGTLKFGDNPKESVLDTDCKMHDLDNLYVTDSSFFPSSSAVNPALTIIANSLRIAEILKHRL